MSSLFQTKSVQELIDASTQAEHTMNRTLGKWNLTSMGVGAIIGAGIFVLTGQAAAQYAGPAIVLSFIISGLACAFAALCYAELAAMIPVAGSAYTYAYATMGRLLAWIIGWDLVLEYLFSASAVAVGWSGYVVSFLKDFGIVIPEILTKAPLDGHLQATGAIMNLPAILICVALTVLAAIGIQESARLTNFMVLTKVIVITLFVIAGVSYIDTANWTPFIPENTGEFGHYGTSGILRGAGVIFFAYIGFDAVSTATQEAKDPQKDAPFGILMSLLVSTVLYIAVALVLTGMVPYSQLNVPDPIAVGVNAAGESLFWLRPFIKLGAIAGLSSVVLVMIVAQPRIFYSMSRDKMLPPVFSQIHPKFRTPFVPTILTGLLVAFFGGIFPIDVLGELVSIGTLLAFVLVCAGVLILRYTRPDVHRPFKTPAVHFVAIMGILGSLAQMVALPGDTWLRLIVWMAIGFAIFFAYSNRQKV